MRTNRGWLLMAAVLLLCGCEPKQPAQRVPAGETVLARVNDTPITDRMVAYHLRGTHADKLTPATRARALESLIEAELVTQYALAQGLDRSKRYQELVRRLELELEATRHSEMLRRVYGELISASVTVPPADVRAYFDRHQDRFQLRLHLGSLQFDDRASAEAALAEIRAGRSFDDLAAALQPPPPAGSKPAWDLGVLPWSAIPFEWHDLVYGLKPGAVSEVFEGRGTGIRLFTLYGFDQTSPAAFENVRSAIENRLREQGANLAFRELIEQLQREARVRRAPASGRTRPS